MSDEREERAERDEREPVLVDNAADEQQVAAAKRTAKRRRAQELADVRALLALPEGRRFLWRLMGHCSAFASVFDDSATRMAHASGRQDVGHFVMHQIEKAKPDAFLTMMQEAAKETA